MVREETRVRISAAAAAAAAAAVATTVAAATAAAAAAAAQSLESAKRRRRRQQRCKFGRSSTTPPPLPRPPPPCTCSPRPLLVGSLPPPPPPSRLGTALRSLFVAQLVMAVGDDDGESRDCRRHRGRRVAAKFRVALKVWPQPTTRVILGHSAARSLANNRRVCSIAFMSAIWRRRQRRRASFRWRWRRSMAR